MHNLQSAAQRRGIDLQRPVVRMTQTYDPASIAMIAAVSPHTMTSPARLVALREAVRYVVTAGVPGAFVECGVWRGGSMMAVARTLTELGPVERELWLYDTFAGMTPPSARDRTVDGRDAADWIPERIGDDVGSAVLAAPLDEVGANLASTGYPPSLLRFVVGRVEETLADQRPDHIALLRLDTDFYESTRAALAHLYPLLAPRGVLIIDDYGYWQGAREAVDEYFAACPEFLMRVDRSARIVIKTS